MGLLSLLKSVVGLGGSGSDTRSGRSSDQRDVDVTVEHEPDPATESEAAVKGTGAGDAAASKAQSATAGDGTETETTETTVDIDSEPDASAADAGDEHDDATEPAVENADDPISDITGIGPSYAERLREIGIETVGDLAAREADEIAAETDLSEKRVGRWLDRARDEE